VISGGDFLCITSPFEFVSGTLYCNCQKNVSLKSVAWEDTGEPISTYRRRMRRGAPRTLRILSLYVSPTVCAAVGAGLGLLIPPERAGTVPAPLVCGGIGLGLGFLLVPVLLSRVWGIDNRGVK
jgi:hypothetical protein